MLTFNDTTNETGIIQQIEDELGFNRGDISGSTARMKKFTGLVNLTWDDYLRFAFKGSGHWQFDDSNHTAYPIIKTNLVQGQRDYTFTTDQQGNLILDIFKVAVLPSASATLYEEIYPIDQQSSEEALHIAEENTSQGVPTHYDKTANGIFLDYIPSYNATNGLKLWINREASYFTTSDTTKKPGCPGNHHYYFVLKPALTYARRNSLEVYDKLVKEVEKYEGNEEQGVIGSIERDFARRVKDEKPQMKPKLSLYL